MVRLLKSLIATLSVATLAAASSATEESGDLIVLKPPSGKTGVDKVLIFINGALVANSDYVDVVKAVQAASDFKLWAALPSFVLNTPNPGEIGSKIKGGIDAIQKAGFPRTIKDDADVVIGGHSLGGIFSQVAVVKGGYAGLVLYGSYLSSVNGYAVNKYPKPTLTLAGEMDGLTRITRIAQSWAELQDVISSKGQDMQYTYPVVALPGVVHSQFCSNVNVTSFGLKDKCAEVSWASAHSAIGDMTSKFLSVLFSAGDVAAAKAKLKDGMKYTSELVSGYLQARKSTQAGEWCEKAQQMAAKKISVDVSVDVELTSNFVTFNAKDPSVEGKQVRVVQDIGYKLNPTDISTFDFSAQEVDCKTKTAAALARALGKTAPESDYSCKDLNDQAIAEALKLVTPRTKERYLSTLKPLVTEDDVVCSTGIGWQSSSFKFDTSGSSVSISSPRLTTGLDASLWPGDQLCKYLSVDRVIEYMMTDGLPDFDACPHKTKAEAVIV